jgi:D-3-phosphoglycerate dehydrogenase
MSKLSLAKDKIKIVLFEGIHERAVESFAEHGYTNVERLTKSLVGDELIDKLSGARMVGIRSRTQLTEEVIAASPRLMAIGCFCIGTNQVALDAAARAGIPVFNAPHSNTRSVAELVIAEMVMMYRGIGDKNTGAHQGAWAKSAEGSHELRGKTLGIIGYGHIGSQVSILAEAFGLSVLFYDIEPKLPMGNAQQVKSLEEMLPRCDFVTLHVPQAPDTKNMIDASRLGQMKPGACLLNLSRGNVVVIEDLAAALMDGHLRGAAIDVFPVEPKSNAERFESPLQGVPNVILTPHIGGSTQEAQFNIGIEVSNKLAMYSDAGATIGAVNFPNISLPVKEHSHRLLNIHHNQPGVLTAINQILSEEKVNVVGQYLQTTPDLGYVVIDVDEDGNLLKERFNAVDGVIRTRILY